MNLYTLCSFNLPLYTLIAVGFFTAPHQGSRIGLTNAINRHTQYTPPSRQNSTQRLSTMAPSKLLIFLLLGFLSCLPFSSSRGLFAEYIGAEFNGVRFTQVPINPNVDFHFILAFAIDYTTHGHPNPTNGHFNPFWDTDNLSPSQVSLIKQKYRNVKVAVSLGGDTVGDPVSVPVNFHANSIESWVNNAVASLTKIIKQYHLDGIDIDYEHFRSTPSVFAECIGRLITNLKKNGVISFASVAPFDDDQVQSHYLALWRKYGHVIDYVNFQFYAYDKLTVSQFLGHFNKLSSQYNGGKIMASFGTDNSGGLKPANGFFRACQTLKSQGKLHGIFIWSADDSKKMGFCYENQAQAMLASGE